MFKFCCLKLIKVYRVGIKFAIKLVEAEAIIINIKQEQKEYDTISKAKKEIDQGTYASSK